MPTIRIYVRTEVDANTQNENKTTEYNNKKTEDRERARKKNNKVLS